MRKTPKQGRETTKRKSQYEIEAIIERRVDQGVKTEVVDIYEEVLLTVWAKILPTLGKTTVLTIARRALHLTARRYATLESVAVTDDGFDLRALKERVDERDKAAIREALKELVVRLFDILAKLTGNVLVDRLTREIEGLDDTRSERAA